ncbi:MAG: hypothetical protein HYV38_03760, partial [Candidatus Levybacteria bacterium]|nr:hypothetical protein [Candidatus Levybacteria bacterium]
MKLAVIGNFDKEISPNSKGGTELFTYSLVRGLISKPSIESIIVFGVGRNHFEDKKVTFIPLLQEERVEFTNHNEFLRKLSVGRE